MTEKNPTTPRRPTTPTQEAGGQTNLDHGVSSLVAQDSPDDSQLGAPGTPIKPGSPSPK